ncbi:MULTISPECIES: hypothetical protein [Pseudomonas]|uniref:hypothetical protein n=1 Tax=Pseudomonas monsensis TaxID=2745509 RepID=UPI001645F412|nr:hypothetical protein [Pseudomonas monsensis]MDZ3826912.1 hypothetical protein [Pseudomonas monsensis]QXH98240.1 hypothetical protein HV782_016885 [Pseudomonas monsensis]
MKKIAVLMFAVLFLAGCANQKFKPEYRTQIHTVKILPVAWKPKEITYMGREQAWGAAVGAGVGTGIGLASSASKAATAALGGAGFVAGLKAGDLASMSTTDAIVYNMETSDINLGTLVKKSFEDQLAASGRFKVVGDNEPADAQIELTVISWGFSLTQGFSSVVYPTIAVSGVMKRGDELIWQRNEPITPFNGANTYGYEPLRYRTEPELLRTALTGVSQIVGGYLVKDLNE